MTEMSTATWSVDGLQYQEIVGGNGVTMAVLLDPPARELPNSGMTSIIAIRAKSNPGSMIPDWEPKDVTDSGENVNYVPMNSCAYAGFDSPGYLGTGKLNGCTTVAAGYREGQDTVQAFLEHYDAESAREVGKSGRLKISELLAGFVGQQAVSVAIAYSRVHNPLLTNGYPYDPEDFPIDAAVEQCQELPSGSSVLLIPYETSSDFKDPKVGHMLYLGLGGSYQMDFGWNGHRLEVGKREEFDDRRRAAARATMSGLLESPEGNAFD